jgi:hypothetical protein
MPKVTLCSGKPIRWLRKPTRREETGGTAQRFEIAAIEKNKTLQPSSANLLTTLSMTIRSRARHFPIIRSRGEASTPRSSSRRQTRFLSFRDQNKILRRSHTQLGTLSVADHDVLCHGVRPEDKIWKAARDVHKTEKDLIRPESLNQKQPLLNCFEEAKW